MPTENVKNLRNVFFFNGLYVLITTVSDIFSARFSHL